MNYPYTKNFFYKSPWRTAVYIDPYSQHSLYHTHVYQHAWWRHYSGNGARGHEYIWTLKHTESSLVFLVWSGVSMIELNQYHASEYNQSWKDGRWKHFRVTGHLCGEFTGQRWIPRTKANARRFDVFFDLRRNKRLSKQWWGWWFETPSGPLWRQFNLETGETDIETIETVEHGSGEYGMGNIGVEVKGLGNIGTEDHGEWEYGMGTTYWGTWRLGNIKTGEHRHYRTWTREHGYWGA